MKARIERDEGAYLMEQVGDDLGLWLRARNNKKRLLKENKRLKGLMHVNENIPPLVGGSGRGSRDR